MWPSLVTLAGLQLKSSIRRGTRVAAMAAIAAIFALAAVFYGFSAIGEALRERFTPVEVQLLLAGISLLVASAAGIAAFLARKGAGRTTTSRETMAIVAAPLAMAIAKKGFFRIGLIIPLVILGGFLAGRQK